MKGLPQALLGGVVLLAVAGTTWLLLDDSAPNPQHLLDAQPRAESEPPTQLEAAAATIEPRPEQPDTRSAVTETSVDLPEPEQILKVSGRVMDADGRPVASAEVRVLHRERFDFERMFRGGRPEGNREDWRERMRRTPLDSPVTTAADGTFTLAGDSFAEAEISVAARHSNYAPSVVERTWKAVEGTLTVGDIVLNTGISVRGVVLDETGQAIANAEVSYSSSSRGGFGGRGGGRFGGNVIDEVIPPATTDASGFFELGPLPADTFSLSAEAAQHMDARTERIELREDGSTPDQKLILVRAAHLSGVVRDPEGNAVAGATVRASSSRDAEPEEDRGRRRGGRGRGDRGDSSETDDEGRFEITEVPPGLVRLEVEHTAFLDEVRDPIDPTQTPVLEIALLRAPTVSGVVLDRHTGNPIETFGIAARPRNGDDFGIGFPNFGRRGGERREDNGAQAPDPTAAWMRERLGGSGEIPERTPEPSSHPQGRFEIQGLEPGDYIFDIDAPGYVRVAEGTVTVASTGNAPLQFAVERGTILTGRVERRDGTPVSAADVQLYLPDPPSATPTTESAEASRGGRGNRGRWGGAPWGRRAVARASTDNAGQFELPPQRPGAFELRVVADGLMDYENDQVVLTSRETQDIAVKMTSGGSVRGIVIDHETGTNVRILFSSKEGERHFAEVDTHTGAYEIHGLPSGGYFANVIGGDGESGRRTMMATFMRQAEKQPDVFVSEGAEVRFDVTSTDGNAGTVSGYVRRNGLPADNTEVQLARVSTGEGAPEDRFRRGMERRMLSSSVGSDGTFNVRNIPTGLYNLQVFSPGDVNGRGGRGRAGSTLHSQQVQVGQGTTTSVHIDLVVSEVSFEIQMPPDANFQRITVAVALEFEAAEKSPREWRLLDSYQRLLVSKGETPPTEIQPGAYLFAVEARGAETVTGTLNAVPGQQAPIRVTLEPTNTDK